MVNKHHTDESEKIPWDDTFKQLMAETLTSIGLKVEEDVKLGKLPLKADLVIIRSDDLAGQWQQHPLWKHCQPWNLVEFKSVSDPILFGDVETWLAYTLLYRKKFEIAYEQGLSAWLIVEYRNKQLEQALHHYQIQLKEILPGFWQAQSLFPIYVVAYRELPFELPYSTLKLFLKSGKSVQEIFDAEVVTNSIVKKATIQESVIAINKGNGQFEIKILPKEVQFSAVNAICVADVNKDGIQDIVLGGNQYEFKPQFSRLDANFGSVLIGNKKGEFSWLPYNQSGFMVKGEIKNLKMIKNKSKSMTMIAVLNNDKPKIFRRND